MIREKLLKVDFGLQDKCCDSEERKESWRRTNIPDELLAFFSELFNIRKTTLLKDYYSENRVDQGVEYDEAEVEEDYSLKSLKIGSLFQIIF